MSAVILQPMNERILVRPIEFNDRIDSKILMPAELNSIHHYCEVVAVGPGALAQNGERIEPTLAVGDKVLMLSKHGTVLRVHGEELRLTSEREILCKVVG